MEFSLMFPVWRKYVACYLVILYGGAGYLLTNNISISEPTLFPLWDIDNLMPFLPWTLIVYSSIFGLIFIMPFLINSELMLKRTLLTGVSLITVNLAFFIIMPIEYPARPAIDSVLEIGSFWHNVYSILYNTDNAKNCFPSMHVSMVTFFVLIFYKTRPTMFKIFSIYGVFVALSTMTTKQHYFIDVVAGLLLAGLVYVIVGEEMVPQTREERNSGHD
ncbi:hypothetical protein A2533_05110 [Candidatus Falkowbacteria bacterium RIFOXYD2_FULL_35_9]|uniref:Inositolphosphotransferase Aur1/Ipt1 domain-containing protein n=1 Tax=Candidatus Falkowbacteria bacterium RIFOXYC2_FULL_36_12 TaxID=1798002 RepID=A0A1F5T067_9BACT|nr:MAG: hypothetical protein A2300_03480 [Candidatus Falkowbacteria bacterium RIFOXYB2_FULL_35_7]OGF32354.1 MAG: hypothetical protein A2478_03475 [Candidatus Falkowbacteria bacterium RIFOXYC2_FULL_36_12]OGF33249.1 MAG: hypothetical protein A2223_03955 [Candidatus Falkowbacteria bacterium RIFOXYA2_FULL_35_8]OGF46468.1 MAG: hypothetical protein A2533_05110 [Candidatus Falkowbacteria bacterium RIFOXYD2_FULL_35_9]